MGGVVTYDKKFREDLTMSFGAMYNQELFGPYQEKGQADHGGSTQRLTERRRLFLVYIYRLWGR